MKLLTVIFFGITTLCSYAKSIEIVYPKTGLPGSVAYIALLKEAVGRMDGKYSLSQYPLVTTEARYMESLTSGIIHVGWSSTSAEIEESLLPIYIPIDKGLLGYRVSFVSKSKKNHYKQISDIEGLRNLIFGQGIGWGDIKLYRANGIKVVSSKYINLFKMVANNRFDLYPRGIAEIPGEVKEFGHIQNLIVEEHFAIYYPWPYYFFVNKKYPKFAKNLNRVLEEMIRDGSFERHFQKYYLSSVKRAKLKKRKIIKLKNPMLTNKTPLHRKELWFIP